MGTMPRPFPFILIDKVYETTSIDLTFHSSFDASLKALLDTKNQGLRHICNVNLYLSDSSRATDGLQDIAWQFISSIPEENKLPRFR